MKETEPSKNARILIVDNDPVAIRKYKIFFKNTDYQLSIVDNCEKGFELAHKIVPDLIISDIGLSGEYGFEFLKNIKKDRYLQAGIFILVTADKANSLDLTRGINFGADDYLCKPLNKEEFLSRVKEFLRIKNLQDKILELNKTSEEAIEEKNKYKTVLEQKNMILSKEKEMLQNSLKQISLMVEERERINTELFQLNKIQEDNFNGIIALLSSVIESKRQYHRSHSKKVAEISTFIAKELKLSEMIIKDIEIASLLHELGKLPIPDDLAMKNPKQYTLSERNFLNLHPVAGAELLQNFSGIKSVAHIIRHFHEHVDGTGLPDKLRRDDIPIGSRIIAVANIFDNLVYQKRNVTMENAFEIIEDMTNTKFDSKIVTYLHQYARMNPLKEEDRTEVISLYQLKPGMELAASIYTQKGAILLPMKTILSEDTISQIARYTREEPIENTIFIK